MRFDQISDHKHDIYLHGKLSSNLKLPTKLLAQAVNKNTKFVFTKTGWFFLKYGSRSGCPEKL